MPLLPQPTELHPDTPAMAQGGCPQGFSSVHPSGGLSAPLASSAILVTPVAPSLTPCLQQAW